MAMQFKEGRYELPWAVAKKPGYDGKASGLYFHFFRTKKEAAAARRCMEKCGQYQEPVRYLPGECYQLGSFVF